MPVGLGWVNEAGGWRLWCWARPGAGRLGMFILAGLIGQLPLRARVMLGEERLGSGVFVPGLRGVMLRMEAWPAMPGGECWMQLVVLEGVGFAEVEAARAEEAAAREALRPCVTEEAWKREVMRAVRRMQPKGQLRALKNLERIPACAPRWS